MLSDVPLEKGPKACRILVEESEGVPHGKDRQKQSWAEELNCPVDIGERETTTNHGRSSGTSKPLGADPQRDSRASHEM